MKVAIVDQTGDKGGGAQLSLELFLQNVPAGIEPVVVFFHRGAFAARIEALGLPVHVIQIDERIRSATRERSGLSALRRLPQAIETIVATLRTIAPDVVYTNGNKAHVLGSIAARRLGLPSVVHHRDLLTGPSRFAFLAALAMFSRERIATSKNVARCFPLPRTTVIDNPVDLTVYGDLPNRNAARESLGVGGDAPIAAIVGRLNRWKGIDRFLRAIAAVNERTPLRGLIVGAPHFRDDALLPELHALRTQLKLDELVTFVDWVADTRSVYAAIDINVNTSDREPFGRTIIEAAASGVPSICFDDSGVSETMIDGETGSVVKAHDETALAQALERYASDGEVRLTTGRAALAWSKRFDAKLHARRVADVLLRAGTSR